MDEKHSQGAGDIKQDDTVGRVVSSPGSPDVASVTGFLLGNSHREKYWRLYLDVGLTRYVEFLKEDTIHATQLAPGRTVVWLKRGAQVHQVGTRSGQIEFLQGEIRRGFLSGIPGMPHTLGIEGTCSSGCGHCTASCTYPGPAGGG